MVDDEKGLVSREKMDDIEDMRIATMRMRNAVVRGFRIAAGV